MGRSLEIRWLVVALTSSLECGAGYLIEDVIGGLLLLALGQGCTPLS